MNKLAIINEVAREFRLRGQQPECVRQVIEQLTNGTKSTLGVAPTGLGKTQIFLAIAAVWHTLFPTKRVLVVSHREELVFQPAERWKNLTGAYPVIEMGEFKTGSYMQQELFGSEVDSRLIVSTVQTLNSGRRCKECTQDCYAEGCKDGRINKPCEECNGDGCEECKGRGSFRTKCSLCQGDGWVKIKPDCDQCFKGFMRRMLKFDPAEIGLVIYDEAHHCPAETYGRLVEYFTQAKLFGCTATADRVDEQALGQVFDEIAFEITLPDAIADGWLCPILQQFIQIDELNLANVRRTAGDLNEGDLEREMMVEKVLHKVTTPTVEIACGMAAGTIDHLLRENRLDELARHVQRAEPTLVFATSVAHAGRMTEIINRYLPGHAVCITGTTPREERREQIRRYQDGQIQFMVSCGVFLEGFDAPTTSVISMARPTESRALYAQAIGRGTRPLPGVADGLLTAEERCAAIAASDKAHVTVIDFVGNSGKHKLISTADILGGQYPDELVEKAIRAAKAIAIPTDMREALRRMQEEEERQRREAQQREGQRRREQEDLLQKQAANRRSGIVAGVTYTAKTISAFDVLDVMAQRESEYQKGRAPSESQMDLLRKLMGKGFVDLPEKLSRAQASQLIGECLKRSKAGFCTYSQAKWLRLKGYDPTEMTFAEAGQILDKLFGKRK